MGKDQILGGVLYVRSKVGTMIKVISESRSVVSDSCDPHGWILQARILQWVAFPFSRGSSQPRDRTLLSHITGRFFTSWATREAKEYWSGEPIPSPGGLPDTGIRLGSPALQADSLPTGLSGKLKVIRESQCQPGPGCWEHNAGSEQRVI